MAKKKTTQPKLKAKKSATKKKSATVTANGGEPLPIIGKTFETEIPTFNGETMDVTLLRPLDESELLNTPLNISIMRENKKRIKNAINSEIRRLSGNN
jgi:hypothetical protein